MKTAGILCLACIAAVPFLCFIGIRVMVGKPMHFDLCGTARARENRAKEQEKAIARGGNPDTRLIRRPVYNNRRPVTPPAPPGEIRGGTSDQAQSELFHKLTPEIRLLIYRELFARTGSRALHIANVNQRLCGIRCRERNRSRNLNVDSWGWQHDCWAMIGDNNDEKSRGPVTQPRKRKGKPKDKRQKDQQQDPEGLRYDVIGLLCSCRRVYIEAIDILYTHTHFHARHSMTVISMQKSLVRHRLSKIRHFSLDIPLELEWCHNFTTGGWSLGTLERWDHACYVIRGMKDLQTLGVSFTVPDQTTGDSVSDEVLTGLLSILARIDHVKKSVLIEFRWQRDLDPVLGKVVIPQNCLFTVKDMGDLHTW